METLHGTLTMLARRTSAQELTCDSYVKLTTTQDHLVHPPAMLRESRSSARVICKEVRVRVHVYVMHVLCVFFFTAFAALCVCVCVLCVHLFWLS